MAIVSRTMPSLSILLTIWPLLSYAAVHHGYMQPTPRPTVDAMPRIGTIVNGPITTHAHFDLFKRQIDGCLMGQHTCADIGIAACCPNAQYCYYDTTASPKCCPISDGTCGNDPCESDSYLCSPSATGSNSCCRRPCAQTQFQCQKQFGGQCCGIGSICVSGNSCSATSAVTGSELNGCPVGQSTCAASLGGGCCNLGFVCGFSGSVPACIGPGTATTAGAGESGGGARAPTVSASGANSSGGEKKGLSTGAKAGIGVGVGIGGLLLLGGAIFLFVRSRRTVHVTPPPQANGSTAGAGSTTMTGPSNFQYASYVQPPAGAGAGAAVPMQHLTPGGNQPPVPAYQESQQQYLPPHTNYAGSEVTSPSVVSPSVVSPLPVANQPTIPENTVAELPTNVGLKGERSGPVPDYFPSDKTDTHELE